MYGKCAECQKSFTNQNDFYMHPCVQEELKRLREAKKVSDKK